jgi:hypothetical protein
MASVIHIHSQAPAKPALAAPCNGCGVCCLSQPCPLGMLVSRRTSGTCSALRWHQAALQYRCSLADSPRPWLAAAARRWIAAGRGCDSNAEVVRA